MNLKHASSKKTKKQVFSLGRSLVAVTIIHPAWQSTCVIVFTFAPSGVVRGNFSL